MRILTTKQVREAEQEAISRPGMSTLVLMQRAGYAVAQFCLAHFKFATVCVVCGKGNNGGDGLVAAESLRRAAEKVSVIILASDVSELSSDAAAMCSRLNLQPLWISSEADLAGEAAREALRADLVLDAIVGTGFKPPLRGLAKAAVQAINDALGTVVAVDLPSGVDADGTAPIHENDQDVVFAHGIITFIAPKPAHVFAELTAGPIAVSEIGVQPVLLSNVAQSPGSPARVGLDFARAGVEVPSAVSSFFQFLQVITGQEVGIAFPPRSPDAHKGDFGHVLVIAGSTGKSGAAALAGMAALRTGAGLVTVASPKSVQPLVAGFAPELMTEGLAETAEGTIAIAAGEKVDKLLEGKDAVVLGPGLSRNQETTEFVRRLVARCSLPLVLDADGLNAFAGRHTELKSGKNFRVLTPHPGEAARLSGSSSKEIQAGRMEHARRLARDTGSCVVLKGRRTIVAGASGETWINMTGNAALAKGGSGDVLSGMIGAALARRRPNSTNMAAVEKSAPEALHVSAFLQDLCAAAAVHLHGLTADLARDMLHENTVIARDLLENLTEAFRDCDLQRDRELFYLQK
jgi:ADP-dependent NAD(P)H-hydrate dehydratase / NAD(P)H-hydrate epimerase